MKKLVQKVANPGSALGEAIGVLIEVAVNKRLDPIAKQNNCIYITAGIKNPKTQLDTKLLLKDSNGVEYNIDAVITNTRMQPLILIESKYIRYKKHNRDKGSWVCTAHQSLRKRFSSVRSSITILAGSWSRTSKAMMKSADIALFEIPFDSICKVLKKFGIDFMWDEKEREKAYNAWNKFIALANSQRIKIGDELVAFIERDLESNITQILDNTIPRRIEKVEIQVTTNLGEVKLFKFDNIEKALEFLKDLDEEKILSTEDSPSLFDNVADNDDVEDKE